MMKKGILKNNNVHLQDHEYKTVKLLLEQGYDIELIPTSDIKGHHRPDIILYGSEWEMKAPEGGAKNTMRHSIQNAKRQSRNIIIDLRRCKFSDSQSIKELEYHFKLAKRLKRMKIITKDKMILDYNK